MLFAYVDYMIITSDDFNRIAFLKSASSHRFAMKDFGVLRYFCPHLMFNSGYLIEFVCLKSDLIDNFDN